MAAKEHWAKLPITGSGRKAWTLTVKPHIYSNGYECWGWCDFNKRDVRISRQTEKYGVAREIFLHEVIHKVCPWLSETAVLYLGKRMESALAKTKNTAATLRGVIRKACPWMDKEAVAYLAEELDDSLGVAEQILET